MTPRPMLLRSLTALGAVVLSSLVGAPLAAVAATPGFTPGNVVVYRVGDGTSALSSSTAKVYLDEYDAGTGALVTTTALPASAAGSNKTLTAGGTAMSEGLLTLNGSYLAATGYNTPTGTSAPSGTTSASVPRTVAVVASDRTVDTTTSLNDFADTNNPRSATTDGTRIWVGGAAGGVRFATKGASTSTSLVSGTYKNVRQVSIYNGQLYTSADPTKASVTVATVGSGLPTSGSNAVTNLPFDTAPTQPYAYSFVTLAQSGTTPDTVYVADNSAGAVVKYSLVSGTWTKEGSVAVAGVLGVTAQDAGGTVSLFATSSSGSDGTLYSLTDSSGPVGTFSGVANLLATAPANEAFRGVAFTPGTTFGTGGTATPTPTVVAARPSLPAAVNDPTNPTDTLALSDNGRDTSGATVSVSSSKTSVAQSATVTGTGATRTLIVTPGGTVGTAVLTIAVKTTDGGIGRTSVLYGLSADQGDPSDRYFSGAGNGSAAIDVGGGYSVLADDENNLLRLYKNDTSGPPVATFDPTSRLPYGATEADLEGAARSGNTLYFEGSMSNTSSGNAAPARSTLFAETLSGSGAGATLTYAGAYTGLRQDLITWDQANGNRYGIAAGAAQGVDGHAATALDLEGFEFAGSSSSTAYLAFRGLQQSVNGKKLALMVPVTNVDQLVTGAASTASFGTGVLFDLGGLGIRDIKENSSGQYLIIAGSADDSNTSFVLYTWDGNPADAPVITHNQLPLVPAANTGSWETITSVPQPLTSGSKVQLLEDNGTAAWYGDGKTTKTSPALDPGLAKSLTRTFTYSPTAVTGVTSSNAAPVTGQAFTATAAIGPGATGSVAFTSDGTDVPGCSAATIANQAATCSVSAGLPAGSHTLAATGSEASTAGLTQTVGQAATSVAVVADNSPAVAGQPVLLQAAVAVVSPGTSSVASPTGTVSFTAGGQSVCNNVSVDASGFAVCSVAAGFPVSTVSLAASYSGDSLFTGSNGSASTQVSQAATTTSVTSSSDGTTTTYTATVAPVGPATGTPTGTVTFSGSDGCTSSLNGGQATCAVPTTPTNSAAGHDVTVSYNGDAADSPSSGSLSATAARVGTTTALSASSSALVTGAPVTVTASVTAAQGSATPTGTVTFAVTPRTGQAVLCKTAATQALSGGKASCTVPAGLLLASSGPYTVQATYSGSGGFTTSSASTSLAVARDTTGFKVTQTPATSAAGAAFTVKAQVSQATATRASAGGTVSFTVTGPPGQVTCRGSGGSVQNKTAYCSVPSGLLTAGSWSVAISYSGDADNAPSSTTVTHTVTS